MSINFRFQKYHYDPWTGRTSCKLVNRKPCVSERKYLQLLLGDVSSHSLSPSRFIIPILLLTITAVEEFDNDVRNMDSPKLSQYMNELRRVKNGLEDLRRESKILERELGFGLGGFPSLMDNSENIIKHAFDSVTDQLQQQIGQQINSSQLGGKIL